MMGFNLLDNVNEIKLNLTSNTTLDLKFNEYKFHLISC